MEGTYRTNQFQKFDGFSHSTCKLAVPKTLTLLVAQATLRTDHAMFSIRNVMVNHYSLLGNSLDSFDALPI